MENMHLVLASSMHFYHPNSKDARVNCANRPSDTQPTGYGLTAFGRLKAEVRGGKKKEREKRKKKEKINKKETRGKGTRKREVKEKNNSNYEGKEKKERMNKTGLGRGKDRI